MSSARASSADKVARHLSGADPVLAGLIRTVGARELPSRGTGFATLARAIIYQQISGAAGDAILRRLRRAHGGPGFPPARWFLHVPARTLRAAGVSPQKTRYLRDLSRQVHSGRLRLRRLPRLSDAEVVEALTAVQGIGLWTAQMYLIFALHRPDVCPSGDLGVRKAVGRAWKYRGLPAPRTVERHARAWRPYRSHAALYLWRSLEA